MERPCDRCGRWQLHARFEGIFQCSVRTKSLSPSPQPRAQNSLRVEALSLILVQANACSLGIVVVSDHIWGGPSVPTPSPRQCCGPYLSHSCLTSTQPVLVQINIPDRFQPPSGTGAGAVVGFKLRDARRIRCSSFLRSSTAAFEVAWNPEPERSWIKVSRLTCCFIYTLRSLLRVFAYGLSKL